MTEQINGEKQMTLYTVETWHYGEHQGLSNTRYVKKTEFDSLEAAEQHAFLYKMGDFLGYKIWLGEPDLESNPVKQEFDKKSMIRQVLLRPGETPNAGDLLKKIRSGENKKC